VSRSLEARPWVCALVVLLAVSGCAGKAKQPKGAITRITESGVIRVGMTGEQPPLSMIARDGEFIGLDVALMRVLARNMGVEAEFVKLEFDQLLDALEAGDIDVVMSGMTITPERVKRVTFVGPYFTSGKSFLTKTPGLAGIKVADELNRSDLKVAALRGSTSEAFARRDLPEAVLVLTGGLDEGIQKVASGEADVLVADRETCSFAVLRFPDAGLVAANVAFTLEPMGIAVPLDQPRLANLIRIYFDALSQSQGLEEAKSFWFKNPAWVVNLR
jgi:polar amino acid transport system substrate-binding protein